MLLSKVIRNTGRRPITQASYTIGLGNTRQRSQQAARISAIDIQYLSSDGAMYLMNPIV